MTTAKDSRVDAVSAMLRGRFSGDVLTDPAAIAAAARMWNARVPGGAPAVVVRCHGTADVRAAVEAARSAGMALSVLGGRHDWGGAALRDGGLLVDLSAMRQVTVDGAEARVAGGATVSDVLDAARPHDLAAAVGTVGSVGFAGLTLGGGYGTLIGLIGLGVDNLLSAEVVLADGQVVTADLRREPDLFWALRGGGGNFGVVTELRTALHPMGTVTAGMIAFGWHEARSVLRGWRDLTASADDALDVMFGVMHTPAGLSLYTVPTWAGDPDQAAAQIDQVRALGTPVMEQVARRALADVVHDLDAAFPHGGNYHLGSRLVPALSDDAIDAFTRSAEEMPGACWLNVHHSHGAATRVPVAGTAYAYREEHLVVEVLGAWPDGAGTAEQAWVLDTGRRLDPHALPGGWANLMAQGDPRAADAYGGNTARLMAVKAQYDPDGVFTAIPLPG